jgi:hypothetical protein
LANTDSASSVASTSGRIDLASSTSSPAGESG